MSEWITLQSHDGQADRAYLARPSGQPRGGLVVLQEIFGVNSHIRAVADGYAAEGFVVVAPSTFDRVQAGVELGYTDSDMQAGFALKMAVEALPAPGVMADIQAGIDRAARESGGRVAVIGFCWGGLLAWRSACELQGLSAAIPYYGGGMTTESEAAKRPGCPVLAHFAEADQWIPLDTVQTFQAQQAGVEVHTYAAHHGFNCDQRGSHDAPSALLARQRTLSFLKQHVG